MALNLEDTLVDVLLSAEHDVVMSGGTWSFTSGATAVVQACKIAMLMVRGENELNLDEGVPLVEGRGVPASAALLGQPFDENRWRSAYRAALLTVDGVVDVVRVDIALDHTTRVVTVIGRVRCAFGDSPPIVVRTEI